NAHSTQQLGQPVPNLICGTNRMALLISHDGYIDGPENARGAARYWSTLRAPYKRWDPTRNRYLSLGYKNQILPLVRGYRGSPGKGKANAVRASLVKNAMETVGAELMGCGSIELMDMDDSGQRRFKPYDFEISLRSSDEVP